MEKGGKASPAWFQRNYVVLQWESWAWGHRLPTCLSRVCVTFSDHKWKMGAHIPSPSSTVPVWPCRGQSQMTGVQCPWSGSLRHAHL